MSRSSPWGSLSLLAVALAACSTGPQAAPSSEDSQLTTLSLAGHTRQVTSTTTAALSTMASNLGADNLDSPALFPGEAAGDVAGISAVDQLPYGGVNRRLTGPGRNSGLSPNVGPRSKSIPTLNTSFDGLNLRNQRFANGGNQYYLEPPDQALCVGNGFVLESVNDVLRVYSAAGSALTGVIDLNTFYGYPAQYNRTTGAYGPFVTDPVCYFDGPTQRWFHAVLTLDTTTRGNFTGTNHLDLAVSQTGDPTGAWTVYRLPVQDDGTDGTPPHPGCPCIGDYPHLGADANGVYLTTNEYPFFADGFNGAQVYAFSKAALAANLPGVTVTQFDLSQSAVPAFTVWPAVTPGTQYATAANGTEYFLNSNAAEEVNGSGHSSTLGVWALSNTASLNTSTPALTLNASLVSVLPYAAPPLAEQKPGSIPLAECINDTSIQVGNQRGCWRLIFAQQPQHIETLAHLDGSDTRMLAVTYANGKLWGALDTGIDDNGTARVGIAWYILQPAALPGSVTAKVSSQGYLAQPGRNVMYPALAVTTSGRGVLGFTVAGPNDFPSAGYAGIDALAGVGPINLAAAGKGPQDGFSGYRAFGDPPRPRWGDYGAAAVDGKTVWFANEYIAQTCTLTEALTSPLFSCGGTRGLLGNWGTRISSVTP